MRQLIRWIYWLLLGLVVVLAVGWLVATRVVGEASAGRVYAPEAAPGATVAIVLGAGVWPDGSLSVAALNRVEAGAALYRRGAVRSLLISADRRPGYDEVGPMREAAIRLGVPAEAIRTDGEGFRTQASCRRARDDFGVTSALVVTQAFHLPRAVYLCRNAGIDAAGVVARDFSQPYLIQATVREQASTLFAWLEALGLMPARVA